MAKKKHTVAKKIHSYKRKATVKSHVRRVKGIGEIKGTNRKPFNVKILRKIFPKDSLGYRERSILFAKKCKLSYVQPGLYQLYDPSQQMYMMFTFNHKDYKDFTVVN